MTYARLRRVALQVFDVAFVALLVLCAAVSCSPVHAQYVGSYLPRTGGTITGSLGVTANVNVQGTLSSTTDLQPAGTTNSGVAIGGGPNYGIIAIYDASQTANNRTAQMVYFQGSTRFRVASDSGAAAPSWLEAAGGQGSGITGITSNSGSGSWSHTGSMSVSGQLLAGSGTLVVYSATGIAVTTPHIVTGTVTLAGGNGTATFTGSAVFSNTNAFVCTAVNTTTNSAVRATNASASSVTFNSGAGIDVIAYQCIGN